LGVPASHRLDVIRVLRLGHPKKLQSVPENLMGAALLKGRRCVVVPIELAA
jgi:hypothetical protein